MHLRLRKKRESTRLDPEKRLLKLREAYIKKN